MMLCLLLLEPLIVIAILVILSMSHGHICEGVRVVQRVNA